MPVYKVTDYLTGRQFMMNWEGVSDPTQADAEAEADRQRQPSTTPSVGAQLDARTQQEPWRLSPEQGASAVAKHGLTPTYAENAAAAVPRPALSGLQAAGAFFNTPLHQSVGLGSLTADVDAPSSKGVRGVNQHVRPSAAGGRPTSVADLPSSENSLEPGYRTSQMMRGFRRGAAEAAAKPSTIAAALSMGAGGVIPAAANLPFIAEGLDTATAPGASKLQMALGALQAVGGAAGTAQAASKIKWPKAGPPEAPTLSPEQLKAQTAELLRDQKNLQDVEKWRRTTAETAERTKKTEAAEAQRQADRVARQAKERAVEEAKAKLAAAKAEKDRLAAIEVAEAKKRLGGEPTETVTETDVAETAAGKQAVTRRWVPEEVDDADGGGGGKRSGGGGGGPAATNPGDPFKFTYTRLEDATAAAQAAGADDIVQVKGGFRLTRPAPGVPPRVFPKAQQPAAQPAAAAEPIAAAPVETPQPIAEAPAAALPEPVVEPPVAAAPAAAPVAHAASILPDYTGWSQQELLNRAGILRERGSMVDQKNELPAIQAAIAALIEAPATAPPVVPALPVQTAAAAAPPAAPPIVAPAAQPAAAAPTVLAPTDDPVRLLVRAGVIMPRNAEEAAEVAAIAAQQAPPAAAPAAAPAAPAHPPVIGPAGPPRLKKKGAQATAAPPATPPAAQTAQPPGAVAVPDWVQAELQALQGQARPAAPAAAAAAEPAVAPGVKSALQMYAEDAADFPQRAADAPKSPSFAALPKDERATRYRALGGLDKQAKEMPPSVAPVDDPTQAGFVNPEMLYPAVRTAGGFVAGSVADEDHPVRGGITGALLANSAMPFVRAARQHPIPALRTAIGATAGSQVSEDHPLLGGIVGGLAGAKLPIGGSGNQFLKMADSARYEGALFGASQLTNVAGNAGALAYAPVIEALRQGSMAPIGAAARTIGNPRKLANLIYEGGKAGWKSTDDLKFGSRQRRNPWTGEVQNVDNSVRAIGPAGRMLQAADFATKNVMTKGYGISPEMAKVYTYSGDPMTSFGQGAAFMQSTPPGRLMTPFARTAINLNELGAAMTPLRWQEGSQLQKVLPSTNKLSEAALGVLGLVPLAAGAAGYGPSSPAGLAALGPFAAPYALTRAIRDYQLQGGDEPSDIARAVVQQQPFIGDIPRLVDDPSRVAQNVIAQPIPQALMMLGDKTVRETRGPGLDNLTNVIKERLPQTRESLPIRPDFFGGEMKRNWAGQYPEPFYDRNPMAKQLADLGGLRRSQSGSLGGVAPATALAGGAMNSMLANSGLSPDRQAAVKAAIEAASALGNDTLTGHDQSRLKQLRGQATEAVVSSPELGINSPAFQALSPEEQKLVVKMLMSAAVEEGTSSFKRERARTAIEGLNR